MLFHPCRIPAMRLEKGVYSAQYIREKTIPTINVKPIIGTSSLYHPNSFLYSFKQICYCAHKTCIISCPRPLRPSGQTFVPILELSRRGAHPA